MSTGQYGDQVYNRRMAVKTRKDHRIAEEHRTKVRRPVKDRLYGSKRERREVRSFIQNYQEEEHGDK